MNELEYSQSLMNKVQAQESRRQRRRLIQKKNESPQDVSPEPDHIQQHKPKYSPRRVTTRNSNSYRKTLVKEAEILETASFRQPRRSQSPSVNYFGSTINKDNRSEQSPGEVPDTDQRRGTIQKNSLSINNEKRHNFNKEVKKSENMEPTHQRMGKGKKEDIVQKNNDKLNSGSIPQRIQSSGEWSNGNGVIQSENNFTRSGRMRTLSKLRRTQQRIEARKQGIRDSQNPNTEILGSNKDYYDERVQITESNPNFRQNNSTRHINGNDRAYYGSKQFNQSQNEHEIIQSSNNTAVLQRKHNRNKDFYSSENEESSGAMLSSQKQYHFNDSYNNKIRQTPMHLSYSKSNSSMSTVKAAISASHTSEVHETTNNYKNSITREDALRAAAATFRDDGGRSETSTFRDDNTLGTCDQTISTYEFGSEHRMQRAPITETFRTTSRLSSSTHHESDFDDETTVFDANTINSVDDENRRLFPQGEKSDLHGNNQLELLMNDGHKSNVENNFSARYDTSESTANKRKTSGSNANNQFESDSENENETYYSTYDEDESRTSRWDSTGKGGWKRDQKRTMINTNGEYEQDDGSGVDKSARNHSENERESSNPIKTALGITAAATLGVVALGPVGICLGVASLGLHQAYLQVPEEKREKATQRIQTTIQDATSSVLKASDFVSNSCALACEQTGANEYLPKNTNCFKKDESDPGSQGSVVKAPTWVVNAGNHFDTGDDKSRGTDIYNDTILERNSEKNNNDDADIGNRRHESPVTPPTKTQERKKWFHKVACMRKTRITPVHQIHALSPSLQPRAWLDVMASANTTPDNKNEAMEEILILAKNKDIAIMLLEEGILDSLMYILSTSFQKLPPPITENSGFSPTLPPRHLNETFHHAKLAANCCVAFGKAHCAVVHTEGDLLLMSAYNRGSVPVERQLAQMLHEVRHHSRVMGTNIGEARQDGVLDDGVVVVGGDHFALIEMSMQQAEEMAKNITALMAGRLDWNC